MEYIRGPNLVAGSYTCAMDGGGIEYGYTFTRPFEGDDQSNEDTVLDLPIGFVAPGTSFKKIRQQIEAGLEKFKWAAEEIVKAAPSEGVK